MKKLVLIPLHKYEQLQNQGVGSIDATDHFENAPEMKREAEEHEIKEIPKERNQYMKLDRELILSHIPKYNKRKAEAVLEYIDKAPKLDWNADGELLLDSREIPGSHISDLLRDSCAEYKNFEPVGAEEFYNNLGNIPLSLITNPKRRLLLQKRVGEKPDTPPLHKTADSPTPRKKKPVNKTSTLNKKTWKQLWRKL
jgi:hypothetical protein